MCEFRKDVAYELDQYQGSHSTNNSQSKDSEKIIFIHLPTMALILSLNVFIPLFLSRTSIKTFDK